MTSNNDTGIYVLIGIIVLVIITLLVGLFFLKEPVIELFTKEKTVNNDVTYKMVIRAMDDNANPIYPNYEVLENGKIKYSGEMSANKVTSISKLSNDSSYVLKLFKDGFYPARTECSLNADCVGIINKRADTNFVIAKLTPNYHRGLLYISEGTFSQPVYCVAWNNILSVNFDKENFPVKVNRQKDYDKCFFDSQSLEAGLYEFDINLEGVKSDSNYKVTVFDDCGLETCNDPITVGVIIE